MKLSDELITRLIWLVITSVNSWLISSWKLEIVFLSWKHIMNSSYFLKKNYSPDFWKKKSNFVLLAFETCQGAIWSSHSVIRVLINLHYDPTFFKAFHSVSFCEISVRFCHHKNRTQISKNFHCAFLFSIPLSYYNPYDDIPIFFTHEFFY